MADALRLTSDDCFLLPHGRPFTLTNDLALTPPDAYAMFPLAPHGVLRVVGGGEDCSGVGGYFTLAGNHADLLLNVLPPVMHIQRESDKTAMRWCLEQMMLELREPRPGGFLLGQQLASMMLVQALRLHLEHGLNRGVGRPFALADKQMSAAMSAMHDAPGTSWTLHQLAIRGGSRNPRSRRSSRRQSEPLKWNT